MSMLKTWLLNNKTVQLIYFMRNFSNNHLTNIAIKIKGNPEVLHFVS